MDNLARKASETNKRKGINFILGLDANGGTIINDALIDAITQAASVKKDRIIAESMETIVLFLTDGLSSVGVTKKLAIKNNIIEVNAVHLFAIVALAFGQDADFNLLITDIAKDSDSGQTDLRGLRRFHSAGRQSPPSRPHF